MDLRGHLLALLEPTRPGDELAPGFVLVDASTELGLQLAFDTGGRRVSVDVTPVEEGAKSIAQSGRFAFGYRSGAGDHFVDPQLGAALCRAVAAVARANEDRVVDSLARDAAAAREASDGATRIREVRVDRVLERGGTPSQPFHSVSPYVGCLIGCRFCYAQRPLTTVRRLEALPEVPWGSYVDVRINAAEVLARELAEAEPLPIKFCPIVSDPYHAVEARYRITRACLEAIAALDTPPAAMVLTRSKLVARDAELIASLPSSYAGVSIPTADDAVRRHFEPRGASVNDRLVALRALRTAGVRTFAVVQPVLPGSIDALADALADTVESVSIDVLRGVEDAGELFADPRYAAATGEDWQRSRAMRLRDALNARGVETWLGELPAELTPRRS